MSKKSRQQRLVKRKKRAEAEKAAPKDSKKAIKKATGSKARIEALNYLVLWNRQ